MRTRNARALRREQEADGGKKLIDGSGPKPQENEIHTASRVGLPRQVKWGLVALAAFYVYGCLWMARAMYWLDAPVASVCLVVAALMVVSPLWRWLAGRGVSISPIVRTGLALALVVVAAVLMPLGRAEKERDAAVATAEQKPDPLASKLAVLRKKIGPDAIQPMKREHYRETFTKLGKAQFANANALMSWAAIAAAESDQCDKIELVDISDRASRKEVQFHVDCVNKERFQITQGQAVAARDQYDPATKPQDRARAEDVAVAGPKSARWKSFNEPQAVVACKTLVRSTMIDRGSFDATFSWDSAKNDETGLVTIQQDFEARNQFGGTISSRYSCVVDADHGSRITKLSIREASGWRKII